MKKRNFAWSLSALKDFERCPRLWAWRRIDKKPEPPSKALERGEKLHKIMEHSLLTGAALPKALAKFDDRVAELRQAKGIEIEKMWCYTSSFEPCEPTDYDNTWLRIKLDYFARTSKRKAHVLDWKSGQIYGDHSEGMDVYAMGVFYRYPEVNEVLISLEYLDAKRAFDHVVKRSALAGITASMLARVKPVAAAFNAVGSPAPHPGKHCGWCPFNASKPGGTCDEGKRY